MPDKPQHWFRHHLSIYLEEGEGDRPWMQFVLEHQRVRSIDATGVELEWDNEYPVRNEADDRQLAAYHRLFMTELYRITVGDLFDASDWVSIAHALAWDAPQALASAENRRVWFDLEGYNASPEIGLEVDFFLPGHSPTRATNEFMDKLRDSWSGSPFTVEEQRWLDERRLQMAFDPLWKTERLFDPATVNRAAQLMDQRRLYDPRRRLPVR